MASYEPTAATAVIGLAGFQLLQAWNTNAPSLAELRTAQPDDIGLRQRLMDSDIMVGGLALILGVSLAVLTKDLSALVVMLMIYGSVSLWFHSVQKAESR